MQLRSWRHVCLLLVVCWAIGLSAAPSYAEEPPLPRGSGDASGPSALGPPGGGPPGGKPPGMPPGLTGPGLNVRGALIRQLRSDIDDGGNFSVTRAVVEAGFRYAWGPARSVGISLGYRFDGYTFGGAGVFGPDAWGNVHSLRLAAPVLWSFDERWTLFAVPTIRATAEGGASLEDGVSGGVLGGISYRFGKNLSLGPGAGVLTEIEDDLSVFPILLVDWKITPELTLRTGRGIGATQGPGVFLAWKPSKSWEVSLGGRYERNRFRLDDTGIAPGGVGEEKSFAAVLGARYVLDPTSSLNVTVGYAFGGELRLEDAGGGALAREDFDPAFFLGLGFDLRF